MLHPINRESCAIREAYFLKRINMSSCQNYIVPSFSEQHELTLSIIQLLIRVRISYNIPDIERVYQ